MAGRGPAGAKWVALVSSFASPIAGLGLLAYFTYWRIRMAEGRARLVDSLDAHILLWALLTRMVVVACAGAMS